MGSILDVLLRLAPFGIWGLPGSPPANWKPFTGGEAGFISPPAASTDLVLTELTAQNNLFIYQAVCLLICLVFGFTWKRTTTTKFPLAPPLSCKLYSRDCRSTGSVKRYRGRRNPSSQLSCTSNILQEFSYSIQTMPFLLSSLKRTNKTWSSRSKGFHLSVFKCANVPTTQI